MQLAGRILDYDTRQSVPYANVTITTPVGTYTGIGTQVNVNGQFYIDNPLADYPNYLTVSHASYHTSKAQLYEDFYIDYSSDFLLKKKITTLDPVIVTSGGGGNNNAWLLLLAIPLLVEKKKTVGKIQSGDVITGGIIIAGLMAFGLVQKLLSSLGINNPTTGEQGDPESPWTATYWRKIYTDPSYQQQIIDDWSEVYHQKALAIESAFSVMADNWPAIKGVFDTLRSKSQVSFLSYKFQTMTGDSLLSFLSDAGPFPWDGLSNEHLQILLNYVAALPQKV